MSQSQEEQEARLLPVEGEQAPRHDRPEWNEQPQPDDASSETPPDDASWRDVIAPQTDADSWAASDVDAATSNADRSASGDPTPPDDDATPPAEPASADADIGGNAAVAEASLAEGVDAGGGLTPDDPDAERPDGSHVDPSALPPALAEPGAGDVGGVTQSDRERGRHGEDQRWHQVQSRFVDDPAAAVDDAAALVDEALSDLRRSVRGQADDAGEGSSTEDLRRAFQRYRDVYRALGNG
jgi:hypothetical protein